MVNTELTRFYDQLLQFPLFQGLSRTELLQMAGNTKFGFMKLPPNKVVMREGDTCQQLFFLIKGQLTMTTTSDDHSYSTSEQLHSPWLIQPEALFGARPHFTTTVQTLTEAHFITLSKDEVLRLLDDFIVFRLNMLNLLATQSQRTLHRFWRRSPQSLTDRIVRFMLDHASYPAGVKSFHIVMKRLGQELGANRIDISKALNKMQEQGLLVLHRGRIEVPSLERLLMSINE